MTAKRSTPEQSPTERAVTQAQAVVDAAERTLADHLADREAAVARLAELRTNPLDTSAAELGEARSHEELLDLGTPLIERAVTEARAELRYALGEHYSATLPSRIDAPALRAKVDVERDNLAAGLRRIGTLIEGWNGLLRSTMDQCQAVDLVEGRCDPLASIMVSADGRELLIHGEPHALFSTQGTQKARTEQALAAAGFDRPEVTVRG